MLQVGGSCDWLTAKLEYIGLHAPWQVRCSLWDFPAALCLACQHTSVSPLWNMISFATMCHLQASFQAPCLRKRRVTWRRVERAPAPRPTSLLGPHGLWLPRGKSGVVGSEGRYLRTVARCPVASCTGLALRVLLHKPAFYILIHDSITFLSSYFCTGVRCGGDSLGKGFEVVGSKVLCMPGTCLALADMSMMKYFKVRAAE